MRKPSSSPKRRRNRQYDAEFKVNALRLVSEGRSIALVADSLGIDKSVLYAWRRQADHA